LIQFQSGLRRHAGALKAVTCHRTPKIPLTLRAPLRVLAILKFENEKQKK
jgi:hypothetical protein